MPDVAPQLEITRVSVAITARTRPPTRIRGPETKPCLISNHEPLAIDPTSAPGGAAVATSSDVHVPPSSQHYWPKRTSKRRLPIGALLASDLRAVNLFRRTRLRPDPR